jgi:ssDNA-binding Zn-finger/Zn-ribbon topoisomerase 1
MKPNVYEKLPKRTYAKGEIKPAGNAEAYGLTKKEWLEMFREQGYVCPICGRGDRKMVTDHYHVRGWKNMEPKEKKKWVRGLLCMWCNYRILRTGITLEKLRNAVAYLEKWEARKPR